MQKRFKVAVDLEPEEAAKAREIQRYVDHFRFSSVSDDKVTLEFVLKPGVPQPVIDMIESRVRGF